MGPPAPWSFPAFTKARLDNGVTVLLCHVPGRPVLHFRVSVLGGARLEGPPGTAAVAAQALMEGGTDSSAEEFAAALEMRGARLHPGVDSDALRVAGSVPAVELAPTMALVAGLLVAPGFRDEDLRSLLRRQVEQLTIQRFQGPQRASQAFVAAAFPAGSRQAIPIEGTPELVAAVEPEDVRAYWRDTAAAERTTVVVVGDLAGTAVDEVVAASFGAWSPSGEPQIPTSTPWVPLRSVVNVADLPSAVQTTLLMGIVVDKVRSEDRAAMSAASHYLGGYDASRLNTRIREQSAASYGARAALEFLFENSVLGMSTAVQGDATALAASVMADEIEALRSGAIDDGAMRAAIDNLARTATLRYVDPAAMCVALERLVVHGLPDDYYDRSQARLLTLSGDDVAATFRSYAEGAQLCGGAAGVASSVRPALEAMGYEVSVLPAP